jgi:hypothetical protein
MLSLVSETYRGGVAPLERDAYLADFASHYPLITDIFWKLERRQTFAEPDVPSWVAAMRGDWELAERLIERMRAEVIEEFGAAPGFERRRVRIVERPAGPYLRWEMRVLAMRAQVGERIRVLDSAQVGRWESSRPLPELVILGDVMYEIRYDDGGHLIGARRFTDPNLIAGCVRDLSALFRQGEELDSYLTREIEPGESSEASHG